jgi:hypothetical protein
MAIPVRSIHVLEGEVAERFEKAARKAEKERGTIDNSENVKAFYKMMDKAKKHGFDFFRQ